MRSKLILFIFGIFTIAMLVVDQFSAHPDRAVVVDMVNATGEDVGVIVIQPVPNERVLVTVNLRGLTPGFHGFHIHENGLCEITSDGDFVTAGGHFDLSDSYHGEHSGDLPLLEVDTTGRTYLSVHTARFHFNDLFDADGSSFIVHVGADNVANIPARYGGADEVTRSNGDAGGRFACGVISAPE